MSVPTLRLRFWGVRGSHPVADAAMIGVGGCTPCVEVELAGGGRLVLDAGTGAIGLGTRLVDSTDAETEIQLLLSHLHWDHIQGLPFFAPLFDSARRVRVWATRPKHEVIAALETQMAGPFFPQELRSAGAAVEADVIRDAGATIAGARIVTTPLRHPDGCSAFRIEFGGAVMVYATDHEAGDAAVDAELIRCCAGADVLVMDAQYTPEEMPERTGWGHSSWRQAAELAAAASVGRLFLFHHDPGHDDAQLLRARDQARAIFGATELATEQLTVDL